MSLIIEGSDCLGKSTFAHRLVDLCKHDEIFPVHYQHMCRPNAAFNFFTHYQDMIMDYAVQDRFHLGGIVWHHRIEQSRLEYIEGWLKSRGSIVVVLYASDEDWYDKRISEDERGNLLSIQTMCDANREFKYMVEDKHELSVNIDFAWDLKSVDYNEPFYPDEVFIEMVLENWMCKLSLLERT